MEIRRGIGVSAGYAIGEALVFDREEYRINRRTIAAREVDGEIERFRKAVQAAAAEIRSQLAAMSKKVRDVAGSILEAQVMLLQDPTLAEEIASEIRNHFHTADFATSRTLRRKIKLLEDSDAEGFAKRVLSDFVELEKALLRHLVGGRKDDTPQLSGKQVIVAHDLSPSQTIKLDRTKVLGILTEVGGLTSHTAIVAKSLGIPAVLDVESIASDVTSGEMVIIDGTTGTVIIEPDPGTLKRYQAMERNYLLIEQRRAKELQNLPAVTTDGRASRSSRTSSRRRRSPPPSTTGRKGSACTAPSSSTWGTISTRRRRTTRTPTAARFRSWATAGSSSARSTSAPTRCRTTAAWSARPTRSSGPARSGSASRSRRCSRPRSGRSSARPRAARSR
jgi:phosphoenolpyruvate-protein kinase (PTS system EI component)